MSIVSLVEPCAPIIVIVEDLIIKFATAGNIQAYNISFDAHSRKGYHRSIIIYVCKKEKREEMNNDNQENATRKCLIVKKIMKGRIKIIKAMGEKLIFCLDKFFMKKYYEKKLEHIIILNYYRKVYRDANSRDIITHCDNRVQFR